MTSFYESATRGLNFDRFVADELIDESTLVKMKQHFWTAKQLLRTKLGKKEDDHLLASDAEFDTKLTLYYSIRDTSRGLLAAIEDIHHFMNGLTENERNLGVLLNFQAREEKEHIANILKTVGDTNIQAARARMITLKPIVRLYHELDTFNDRAITDCTSTIEAAEKARLEYRGSLLWMKKATEELDPDANIQMDKYRTAQTVVRQNKEKLDKLKEDTLQKVDLLEESRSIFLYEATLGYLDVLHEYMKEATQVYANVLDKLQGIDSYEIDVLKILNDPVGLAKESEEKKRRSVKAKSEPAEKEAPNAETSPITYDLLNFDDEDVKVSDSGLGLDKPETSNLFNDSDDAFLKEVQAPDEVEPDSLDQLKSLIEARDEIRPDSPLGILDISSPLPPLPSFADSQPVPKLQPPSGWINKVKSTAQEIIKPQQGLFGGSFEANFMPSRLFDQNELALPQTSAANDKDWSNWLSDFDPLKKPNENEQNPNQI